MLWETTSLGSVIFAHVTLMKCELNTEFNTDAAMCKNKVPDVHNPGTVGILV